MAMSENKSMPLFWPERCDNVAANFKGSVLALTIVQPCDTLTSVFGALFHRSKITSDAR